MKRYQLQFDNKLSSCFSQTLVLNKSSLIKAHWYVETHENIPKKAQNFDKNFTLILLRMAKKQMKQRLEKR